MGPGVPAVGAVLTKAYPDKTRCAKNTRCSSTKLVLRFRVHSAYSGAKWIQQLFEPHIELNPSDAAARGLVDGDEVEV